MRGSRPFGRAFPIARLLALAAAFAATSDAIAQATPPQQLVDRSDATLRAFLRDPDMAWLRANLARARGVLIAPEMVRAGLIIGGSGGRAVLLVRDPSGNAWRGPAFYTFATGSVGLQAGIASAETITLVMTDKGVNALLAPSVKLGTDASVAAGPIGTGAARTPAGDFVSVARSKGAFGGLDLDGSVITANSEWNAAYYGRAVLATDVLRRGGVANPDAAPLLATLTGAGS